MASPPWSTPKTSMPQTRSRTTPRARSASNPMLVHQTLRSLPFNRLSSPPPLPLLPPFHLLALIRRRRIIHNDRRLPRRTEHDLIGLTFFHSHRRRVAMHRADAQFRLLGRVVRNLPKVLPDFLRELRHPVVPRVRLRRSPNLIERLALIGSLSVPEHALEEQQRAAPLQIGLLDIFVVEFDQPTVNVDRVTLNPELPRNIQREPLVVHFHKLDQR